MARAGAPGELARTCRARLRLAIASRRERFNWYDNSQYSDLNWVGESIAETIRTELSGPNQIVLDRESRAEGMRRLF